ncbi:hypothetical protein [Paenibacillus polymyxa]|uniref:hypothetical protein n=1 Tax=Paenibacillus polymyxa TaxID=1406 RepID=UPI0023F753A4|nr:hypothetical protein [Paenibacillus polymyxa]
MLRLGCEGEYYNLVMQKFRNVLVGEKIYYRTPEAEPLEAGTTCAKRERPVQGDQFQTIELST